MSGNGLDGNSRRAPAYVHPVRRLSTSVFVSVQSTKRCGAYDLAQRVRRVRIAILGRPGSAVSARGTAMPLHSYFRFRVVAAFAGSVLVVASTGRATLKADIPQPPYQAGISYWGSSGNGTWIQYIAGDLPVIFSSGHDGGITTSAISDRVAGNCNSPAELFSTERDTNRTSSSTIFAVPSSTRTGRSQEERAAILMRTSPITSTTTSSTLRRRP
jgi:hypothetical protein